MKKPLPAKIIFDETDGHVTQIFTPAPLQTERQNEAGVENTPRSVAPLVPPSSRASLPSNVFVTSVDVEAGFVRHSKKRRVRAAAAIEYAAEQGGHGHDESALEGIGLEDEVALDYGGADDVPGQGEFMLSSKGDPLATDLDVQTMERLAEESWTTLFKITRPDELNTGDVVGYKVKNLVLQSNLFCT